MEARLRTSRNLKANNICGGVKKNETFPQSNMRRSSANGLADSLLFELQPTKQNRSQSIPISTRQQNENESIPPQLRRRSTFAQRIDEFFTQNDDSSDSDSDENNISTNDEYVSITPSTDYKWTFHYTVSYWITVKSIFADFLFTISSAAWFATDSLHPTDYYVLITITGFVGMILYVLGGYIALFQIMNDKPYKRKRWLCCYNGTKTITFWGSLIFLSGSCVTLLKNFCYVVRFPLPIMADASMALFSGCCYFIGGVLFMYANKAWKWRPHNLAWWASILWGIGGFCFLVFGIGSFWPKDQTITFWFGMLPSILGMLCYLMADVFTVSMWKLEQYGNIYLPKLNKNEKNKRRNVLYRDIAFLALYILSATVFLIGLSYACLCEYFQDWIKGFVLGLTASFSILLMGSFLHKEPEKAPFSYLLWYLRFYFLWMTVNAMIDTYHISGTQCHQYGCVQTR